MKFGIDESLFEKICAVFAACPQVEEVVIYGSRAKGNFRPNSDVDLAFRGRALSRSILGQIRIDLEEDLPTLLSFDVLWLDELKHEDLLDHIRRVGQVFYKKQPELAAA